MIKSYWHIFHFCQPHIILLIFLLFSLYKELGFHSSVKKNNGLARANYKMLIVEKKTCHLPEIIMLMGWVYVYIKSNFLIKKQNR